VKEDPPVGLDLGGVVRWVHGLQGPDCGCGVTRAHQHTTWRGVRRQRRQDNSTARTETFAMGVDMMGHSNKHTGNVHPMCYQRSEFSTAPVPGATSITKTEPVGPA
jgi:hypothetical protein